VLNFPRYAIVIFPAYSHIESRLGMFCFNKEAAFLVDSCRVHPRLVKGLVHSQPACASGCQARGKLGSNCEIQDWRILLEIQNSRAGLYVRLHLLQLQQTNFSGVVLPNSKVLLINWLNYHKILFQLSSLPLIFTWVKQFIMYIFPCLLLLTKQKDLLPYPALY